MIQKETKIKIADNSGAKFAKCISIFGGFTRRYARLGDIILVTVHKVFVNKKLRKKPLNRKSLYFGLIISTKNVYHRQDGSFFKFDTNRLLLLNRQLVFLGTRVYGPIVREVRVGKNAIRFSKIISYSKFTV